MCNGQWNDMNTDLKRVVIGRYNWRQFCATTCLMASYDWQKCVSEPCRGTSLPITTCYVASCDIKLYPIM